MSRHDVRPLPGSVVVTRGAVGWDRPLQTFFAQLFSIEDEGEERPHVWIGTYPHELNSAAAALAVVDGDCIVPDGLAKTSRPIAWRRSERLMVPGRLSSRRS